MKTKLFIVICLVVMMLTGCAQRQISDNQDNNAISEQGTVTSDNISDSESDELSESQPEANLPEDIKQELLEKAQVFAKRLSDCSPREFEDYLKATAGWSDEEAHFVAYNSDIVDYTKNALGRADYYLKWDEGYSKNGLIAKLKSDGFEDEHITTIQSVIADTDWNEQAARRASWLVNAEGCELDSIASKLKDEYLFQDAEIEFAISSREE